MIRVAVKSSHPPVMTKVVVVTLGKVFSHLPLGSFIPPILVTDQSKTEGFDMKDVESGYIDENGKITLWLKKKIVCEKERS